MCLPLITAPAGSGGGDLPSCTRQTVTVHLNGDSTQLAQFNLGRVAGASSLQSLLDARFGRGAVLVTSTAVSGSTSDQWNGSVSGQIALFGWGITDHFAHAVERFRANVERFASAPATIVLETPNPTTTSWPTPPTPSGSGSRDRDRQTPGGRRPLRALAARLAEQTERRRASDRGAVRGDRARRADAPITRRSLGCDASDVSPGSEWARGNLPGVRSDLAVELPPGRSGAAARLRIDDVRRVLPAATSSTARKALSARVSCTRR